MTTPIRYFILASVCWLIVYTLGVIRVTEPISKSILYMISPVMYSLQKIKIQIKNESAVITEARLLSNKYKAVIEQNQQLRFEVAQLKLLKEENVQLREQLGAPDLDKFKLVPAKVISRDNGLAVVFDKTTAVTQGSVVVYKNNFVGIVQNATDRSAYVMLVTDPKMQMPVTVINDKNELIKGISSGQFGTGVTVERIEQNNNIQVGNTVVLDKRPGVPEGIVVGEISEIQKVESELFQRAKVQTYIGFDSFDTIFIIQ